MNIMHVPDMEAELRTVSCKESQLVDARGRRPVSIQEVPRIFDRNVKLPSGSREVRQRQDPRRSSH